ncbi:hypothetical protein C2I36_09495 [Rhodobacteraceae bacterium WD3A24]|nr:hypothetical protein C2I36_09495 [Rhodobacteraceae bacterium WD3A24]
MSELEVSDSVLDLSMTEISFPKKQAGRGFGILTPYLIPPEKPRKRLNLGDGFIFHAIERLLGPFAPDVVLSSRSTPEPAQITALASRRAIILGGANQLSDNFRPWPTLEAGDIDKAGLTFVPMGVGLNGLPKNNCGFTPTTRAIIRAMHERIPYSSWRCPRTVALLQRAFPDLADRFLMTGCPVLYDRPLLEGEPFNTDTGRIAVTVTERGDFMFRETSTLREIARLFPDAEKLLVLHQDFRRLRRGIGPSVREMLPGSWLGNVGKLHAEAKRLGYRIVAPATARECIDLYQGVDLHVGSRLHAHLLCLSRARRSFLTYVDNRSLGVSEFLDFPLVRPGGLEDHLNYDFETVRANARQSFANMRRFINSLESLH